MLITLRQQTSQYPDLTYGQPYLVIGIEADDFRLLNDRGCPYLYPHDLFELVDPAEPDDWLTEWGPEGERYAYPSPLNTCGFFEDFFDAEPDAIRTFWRVLNQRLAMSA